MRAPRARSVDGGWRLLTPSIEMEEHRLPKGLLHGKLKGVLGSTLEGPENLWWQCANDTTAFGISVDGWMDLASNGVRWCEKVLIERDVSWPSGVPRTANDLELAMRRRVPVVCRFALLSLSYFAATRIDILFFLIVPCALYVS